jgi:hypothetical protein
MSCGITTGFSVLFIRIFYSVCGGEVRERFFFILKFRKETLVKYF